ncbi:unnamed protein product [Taenia asiatica]|uniref:Protein kinase domain-containing protein n=1 Tax=Taenia asiatica TaxID=60517 RepID=A0A0R3WD44_TAEAS|nr:unnamed protein product [Taenia asiatica]
MKFNCRIFTMPLRMFFKLHSNLNCVANMLNSLVCGASYNFTETRALYSMFASLLMCVLFKKHIVLICRSVGEPASVRRCQSGAKAPSAATSPSLSPSATDSLLPCQLIRQEDVNLHKENNGHLGSGSFGVVRRGDWKTPTGKTLLMHTPIPSLILRHSKTGDVMLMQSVSHPNLVRIYGIIPLNPLVIVTELAPLGSLLTALRAHSRRLTLNSGCCGVESRPATAFSVDVLWDIGIQLARGMAHLAACHLIHRDLAARNVLLFSAPSNVTVKIGDFGLLRRGSLTTRTHHALTFLPHRSPPEAICGRRFSQASDVWSWGVTVWEVWSGGAEPWPGLSSDAVLAELKAARRLAWPRTTCPRRLYQLLLATWRYEPAHRPSFEYLVERLDKVCPVFRDYLVQFYYLNTAHFRLIMKLWGTITTLAIKLFHRAQLTGLARVE